MLCYLPVSPQPTATTTEEPASVYLEVFLNIYKMQRLQLIYIVEVELILLILYMTKTAA